MAIRVIATDAPLPGLFAAAPVGPGWIPFTVVSVAAASDTGSHGAIATIRGLSSLITIPP